MTILCEKLATRKAVKELATIKSKDQRDFRIFSSQEKKAPLDFNKIRIGKTTYANDVTANVDFFKTGSPIKIKRERIERAIRDNDLAALREYSNEYFYNNGIYSRLCRYMAYLFRYDWVVTPVVYDNKVKNEKVQEGWYKASILLDNSALKKNFGEIALKVIKDGSYYGYKLEQNAKVVLQDLPVDYCRSRYELNGIPIVEFNVKYFDDAFKDVDYRLRVLKMFPKEFQKGYVAFKQGKLPKDFQGDEGGWIPLEAGKAVKFNLSSSDRPIFVSIIPALLDLEDAQDLDKKKMQQQIMKVIIQKMPIDKNGDLIFDVDEAQQLHANAVGMLGNAIGVDVLTTFADVDVADLSDKGNVSSVDQLEKVERTVYNEAGVSQMQFNTDGNLALEKSILNDEATMNNLLLQFEEYGQGLLTPYNKNPKKLKYMFSMLPTTIYNYKDLSKTYKEQTMIGFSKLLPQVALGQSQSMVMANAYFENEIMELDKLFIPPQMSSTMSGKNDEGGSNKSGQKTKLPSENPGGRPEKPDDEKSTKTIQNKESQG